MLRVVIDDERTFAFDAEYARNSQDAISMLTGMGGPIDELWLDHDLGGDDTILPVIDILCEMSHYEMPLDVGVIYVHTQNPVGGNTIMRVLKHYGYNVKRVGLPEVR